MKQIYIIEHLEKKLARWTLIEYKNISKVVGRTSLWFTNIKRGGKQLKKLGKVYKEHASELNLKYVCVLDPESPITLSPKEAKKFKYFVFGGILGDYPPKKRTKQELTRFMKNTTVRNIGKKQMSTDNAIYTVHQIAKGKKLSDLKFKDKIEIKLGKFESIILPYCYNLVNGKPFMSDELPAFLKRKKGF